MTTVPLPRFLPTDTLDEFRKFDGPQIYLAAPLGHQNPSVREDRFENVNRYCGHLIRQRTLVFSLRYCRSVRRWMRTTSQTASGMPLDSNSWRAVTR